MKPPLLPFVSGHVLAGPHLLVEWLRTGRYQVSTEAKLQEGIGARLLELQVTAWREYRLAPGERIDFFVEGGVGIEAKTKCSARQIYRQLERYALQTQITSLILITGTPMGLPPAIHGKPVFYVGLGRTSL